MNLCTAYFIISCLQIFGIVFGRTSKACPFQLPATVALVVICNQQGIRVELLVLGIAITVTVTKRKGILVRCQL